MATLIALASVTGCGTTGDASDAAVAAQVDTDDDWCEGSTAFALPWLFELDSVWYRTDTANLMSRVNERVGDIVWLDGLGPSAVALGDGTITQSDGTPVDVTRSPVNIWNHRFWRVEVADTAGGTVYLQVILRQDGLGTKGVVWIDSASNAHFLGDCSASMWTEPFKAFSEHIQWTGTGEELLRLVIEGGDHYQKLVDFYAEPEPPGWDERLPIERTTLDEDMPEALAGELGASLLEVEVPESWLSTNTLLCSFVPEVGWNPCVPLVKGSTLRSPVEIEAYHFPGNPIELWLLDATDNARRVLIGDVTFAKDGDMLSIALIDPAPTVRQEDQLVAPASDEAWFQVTGYRSR